VDFFFKLDWVETFVPQLSLPETLIRGTVVYFALLVFLRVIPKWETGTGSIASMLLAVMLGGLAADGVKGKGESVTDLLLMIATVMFWVFVVDWLSYKHKWFHYLAQDPPTLLVRDGKLIRKNLRREFVSEEDLEIQLRQKDVKDIANVLYAYLEADGSISVIRKDSNH
jgi:uncharacterized membrane protein YcaP (DUF421 family)